MYTYESIKELHIELTDKCNLSCPQCARNKQGGATNPLLHLGELSIGDIQKYLPVSFIQQLQRIILCGNYGDPIVASDCLDIIRYFREINPSLKVSLNTNGSLRKVEWWTELGQLFKDSKCVVHFGIDGLEDTNHLYRRNSIWSKVMENAQAYINAGGVAYWDYLVFRHNEHQVEEAKRLSEHMGFSKFQMKATSRFKNRLQNTDYQEVLNRNGDVEYLLEKPLNVDYQNKFYSMVDTITEKYGSMENYFNKVVVSCKVKSAGSLYITSEGYVFPCCWLGSIYNGSPASKMESKLFAGLTNNMRDINIRNNTIANIINGPMFKTIEESWTKETGQRLMTCARICGIEADPFSEQFKK